MASISLTRGAMPGACALWVKQGRVDDFNVFPSWRAAVCYSLAGTGHQYALTGFPKPPDYVALRHDGRALAWAAVPSGSKYSNDLYFAQLTGGDLANVTRVPPGSQQCCVFAMGLAWAGGDRLMIDVEGQSDEGGGAAVMPLDRTSIRRGWRRSNAASFDPPVHDMKVGYYHLDGVASATRYTALAIERPSYMGSDPRPASRAVQLKLSTGTISAVIATADTGSSVVSVSGRRRAMVYQTQASTDRESAQYYLRLAGQTRGTLITGLPEDTLSITAQP